jgi:hypothetical protein
MESIALRISGACGNGSTSNTEASIVQNPTSLNENADMPLMIASYNNSLELNVS